MIVSFEWDARELNRAMDAVARESTRADFEIITMNARQLLRAIVYNTPRDTGSARAGFWSAWSALGNSGSPGTRRGPQAWKRKDGREYVPEGTVRDDRQRSGVREFEFVNKTHYIDKRGKKVYYPYILNARSDFWGKGEREATFKFGKVYERLMRKHSR